MTILNEEKPITPLNVVKTGYFYGQISLAL